MPVHMDMILGLIGETGLEYACPPRLEMELAIVVGSEQQLGVGD